MLHFNVDIAVECVKSISDNTQCMTCDNLVGPCVRFPCGHSACENCAQRTGECLSCVSSPASYVIDKPQTARFNNASALLVAFQNTFNIDVYKRQKIFDHLKLEKSIFPECIQAPHKYSNKRKSSNISFENKENISPKIFPGEEIEDSGTLIMKKSVQYVQNWLHQNDYAHQKVPRRPFGDISINTPSLVHKTKQNGRKQKNVTAQVGGKESLYRKRSHLKSIHKIPPLLTDVKRHNLEINNPQKQLEIKKEEITYGHLSHKCDNNESGIVLDDEPILIEDNETNIIDKDKQAWLAVIDAAKKDEQEENNLQNERDTNNRLLNIHKLAGSTLVSNQSHSGKVSGRYAFYKKSSILETCMLCKSYMNTKINSSFEVHKSNDVSIVINNSAFITTIKFAHCNQNKKTMVKNSVSIQTENDSSVLNHEMMNFDANISPLKRKNIINNDCIPPKMLKTTSRNLNIFGIDKNTKQISSDNSLKKQKCLIIEDSDTDSSLSCNNTQEVVVDVHKPSAPENVVSGILRTLSETEYEHKTKRQTRGHTPNSSNSSDKENLDPNRKKVMKLGKKHKNKKR